jgi:hypothetical protein
MRALSVDLSVNTPIVGLPTTDQMLVFAKDLQTQYEKAPGSASISRELRHTSASGCASTLILVPSKDIQQGRSPVYRFSWPSWPRRDVRHSCYEEATGNAQMLPHLLSEFL